LLFAGVAAAALMGVGLGLWARPAMSERQLAAAPAARPAPEAPRILQIVVDNTPAPLGAPIELLPVSPAPVRVAPPVERMAPEPMAPVRPPAGLVRVQSVEAEPVETTPPRKVAPKPIPKIVKAVEKPRPVAKAKPVMQVKALVAKPKPAHLEKAKLVEKPRPKPQLKLAKVTAKPAAKPAKISLAKLDRRAKPARIEKVAAAPKPSRLRGMVHAIARAAPRRVEPALKLQKAKVERRAVAKPLKPRVEKTVVKARPAKPRVERVVVKARPVQAAPVMPLRPARGAGPLRLAKYTPRPDTTIRDADRQMSRAYSSARAAGVPDWQLRRQQQRWEAARASAAREAPWAVHDVYLARIAELHDLTRDAQDSGY